MQLQKYEGKINIVPEIIKLEKKNNWETENKLRALIDLQRG